MRLREIQKELLSQIFSTQEQTQADTGLLEINSSSSALSPLDIYRGSIVGGLLHALLEAYPLCSRLVGEPFFNEMAEQYCLSTPSTHPDLNTYGATFADFIEQYEAAGSVYYLADMARLEWLCHLAFMASNDSVSNLAGLGDLSEQDMINVVFYLSADCFLMISPYPVERIRMMHLEHGDDAVDELVMDADAVKLLVWRPRQVVSVVTLTDEQYTFLHSLEQHLTLAETCERCIDNHPGIDINSLVETITSTGWVQGYYIKDTA